jgi:hypothetical protein
MVSRVGEYECDNYVLIFIYTSLILLTVFLIHIVATSVQ